MGKFFILRVPLFSSIFQSLQCPLPHHRSPVTTSCSHPQQCPRVMRSWPGQKQRQLSFCMTSRITLADSARRWHRTASGAIVMKRPILASTAALGSSTQLKEDPGKRCFKRMLCYTVPYFLWHFWTKCVKREKIRKEGQVIFCCRSVHPPLFLIA